MLIVSTCLFALLSPYLNLIETIAPTPSPKWGRVCVDFAHCSWAPVLAPMPGAHGAKHGWLGAQRLRTGGHDARRPCAGEALLWLHLGLGAGGRAAPSWVLSQAPARGASVPGETDAHWLPTAQHRQAPRLGGGVRCRAGPWIQASLGLPYSPGEKCGSGQEVTSPGMFHLLGQLGGTGLESYPRRPHSLRSWGRTQVEPRLVPRWSWARGGQGWVGMSGVVYHAGVISRGLCVIRVRPVCSWVSKSVDESVGPSGP